MIPTLPQPEPAARRRDGAAGVAASGAAPGGARTPRLQWLPAAVLALSLVLTGLLGAWSARNNTRQINAELDREASAFAAALTSRIQSYVDTLPGLRTFGLMQRSPSDADFLRYVQAISLQRRFPGLALTFMADLVPNAARAAYVDAVASDRSSVAEGHPRFAIQPPGERPVYMVLRHTYPLDLPAFGYDLFDPGQHYRSAVEAAIASGQYVATGPLQLARDRFATGQPRLTSVVIRAAVYAKGVVPATPETRAEAAQGVVGISFHTDELVRSVLPPRLLQSHRIVIVDAKARSEGANDMLFDSAWADPGSPGRGGWSEAWRTRIQVADRTWDIEVGDLKPALAIDRGTWWLLALGLALSAALATMTRILVQANIVADSRVRNATAALEAEKENLRRSEMRYRMLFDHSQDGVMRTLPGGAILAANPAACAMYGRSEAELQAAARDELIDATDPRLAVLEAQRQATGSAHGVVRMRRADGSLFEAEVSTSAYVEPEPGRRLVASVIVRDITERQTLMERHRQLAAILDATPDFVGSTDPEGRNIFLNRAARTMLGYGPHDDVSALTIAECHPPWARRLVLAEGVPAAMRDGCWTGRTAVAAADGREIAMLQTILCHRGADGEVTHLSTIGHDLTELERTQAERRSLELGLREAQKMESIGTLAGGVAHDFNNVLAAILGNTVIARQDLDPGHPAQRSLALIQQAAARARTLVQQIMTFSRRSPQELTVQAMRPLVDEAVGMLRATLPASVNLETALANEPLHARVDGAQVQQVVLNLCTNAWQALPGQHGRVRIGLERVDAATPWVRLRVEDNGIGMSEATRLRIFEPFFTTKAVGHGTGLGLAVVHGIVTASGGRIDVTSRLGEGTRFDVLLPLAQAEAAGPRAEDEMPVPAQGRGEEVLYVDDDEVVSLTVNALLRRAGYRITCVAGAAQALDLVRERPRRFAVVVTDYNMPDMSGIALADALARAAPGLPVVICSGYVTEELRMQGRACGVHAVLPKEYAFERLGAVVQDILAGQLEATAPR